MHAGTLLLKLRSRQSRNTVHKHLVALAFLLLPDTGSACSLSCPEPEFHYRSAKYLFLGKVTKVKEYGINWHRAEPKIKVFFDISKNWKGNWGDKPLRTIYNGFSCEGYYFAENEIYIIFVTDEKHFSLCDAVPYDSKLEAELDEIHKNQ